MMMRMPWAPALLLWIAVPALAQGAGEAAHPSFDCRRAATAVEHAICRDPQVAAQDAALARAYAQALALRPNPRSLCEDQRRWLTETRDRTQDLHAAYAARLDFLKAAAAAAASARTPRDEASLRSTCIPIMPESAAGSRCQVIELAAVAGATDLFYQSQFQVLDDVNRARAVVVLARQRDGRLLPVVWDSGQDLKLGVPALLRTPAGVLLDLPAGGADDSGLGTGNLESLYAQRASAWHVLDTTSWQRDLLSRIGDQVRIIRDIYPDWAAMSAQSNLWEIYENGRSPAAPHAGSVRLKLRLEGDKVVIADFKRFSEQVPDE